MSLATGRRPLLPVLLLSLVLAACTAAQPAAEPSALPSPTETSAATAAPTEQPTPTATVTAGPTSASTATPYEERGYGGYEPPAATTPTAGAADATVSIVSSAEHGEYLTGPNGFALYVFAQDEPGVSNCSGGCADAWPPLTLEMGETPTGGAGVTGDFDLLQRSRGVLQVTYNGAPLYYFVSDEEPGDTNGEGVGGVWSLARP
jgi:predicted lipoprotein with Yx(FWY)xxD motif